MSLVRAMDRVPRAFLSPLSACLDRRLVFFCVISGEASALDDEARHDTVEDGPVEELVLDVAQKLDR